MLIGTEPFWRLDVKGGELSLARPDAAAVLARDAGLAVSPTGAIWTGQSGDQGLVARVKAGACSDGPIREIRPSVTNTSAAPSSLLAGSTTRPPEISNDCIPGETLIRPGPFGNDTGADRR